MSYDNCVEIEKLFFEKMDGTTRLLKRNSNKMFAIRQRKVINTGGIDFYGYLLYINVNTRMLPDGIYTDLLKLAETCLLYQRILQTHSFSVDPTLLDITSGRYRSNDWYLCFMIPYCTDLSLYDSDNEHMRYITQKPNSIYRLLDDDAISIPQHEYSENYFLQNYRVTRNIQQLSEWNTFKPFLIPLVEGDNAIQRYCDDYVNHISGWIHTVILYLSLTES